MKFLPCLLQRTLCLSIRLLTQKPSRGPVYWPSILIQNLALPGSSVSIDALRSSPAETSHHKALGKPPSFGLFAGRWKRLESR
jgi:hypothetical protein